MDNEKLVALDNTLVELKRELADAKYLPVYGEYRQGKASNSYTLNIQATANERMEK